MYSTWLRFPAPIFSLLVALAVLTACQQSPPTTGLTPGAATSVASPTSLAVVSTPSARPTTLPTATAAVTTATATHVPPSTPTVGPTDAATATPASGTATASPTTMATPATTTVPADGISAGVYLDDRSGPGALIRSYYNAINRKEYVRAYSYWASGAASSHLAPFPQFQQGYASTASVQLALGTIGGDVGAGQIYYFVPVSLAARTADGATQTFVGCYRLHLARPDFQAVPPFQPMGIRAASIQQVPNGTDTVVLMGAACH